MKKIKVTSARQLTTEQKKKIENFFTSNNTEEVSFDYSIDEKLIAGVSILDGNTVYDGSMASKISKVKNFIK